MATVADCLASDAETRLDVRDFDRWMRAEQRRIFLLAFRFLRNRDEADMATQDVFLKAYRALENGTGGAIQEPARWLTRVAVRTCLDRLRSQRWKFWQERPPQDDEKALLGLAAAAGPGPEEALFARQVAQRLARALDRLSARQKSVFILRHYEDRSLEEIAGILDLRVGTVKSHLARALATLRRELRDLYGRETPVR